MVFEGFRVCRKTLRVQMKASAFLARRPRFSQDVPPSNEAVRFDAKEDPSV
jgi:hypothetical protein